MSLLVEIATRADVPLESVVRVLTREAVNDEHKHRVLAVLDHLDAEETRVLQRFALAAVHDALPPGGFARLDHESVVAELVEAPLELPEAVRFDVEQVASTEIDEAEVESLPATVDAAPLVQLGSVLTELTEAVRELRHETDAERRERVDDLAVLIDLITKGWEGVDRRLGRVERQLGRLESAPPPRAIPVAAAASVEPPPVPDPDPPPPPPEAGGDPSTLRRRLPLIAAIAFGIAIGALAARDLGSRFDAAAIVGKRSTAEAAQRAQLPVTIAQQPVVAPSTTAPTSVPKPPARRPSTAPARTAPPPTTAARTTPAAPPTARPASTPATTAQGATTIQAPPTRAPRPGTPSAGTTAPPPATTTAAPRPAPPDFTPSRNWAWPPAEGADYYLVEFFRGGQLLYRARPTEPRLTLPDSVQFSPGPYRWRVRPGHGAPSENRLDAPIVDSEFILNG